MDLVNSLRVTGVTVPSSKLPNEFWLLGFSWDLGWSCSARFRRSQKAATLTLNLGGRRWRRRVCSGLHEITHRFSGFSEGSGKRDNPSAAEGLWHYRCIKQHFQRCLLYTASFETNRFGNDSSFCFARQLRPNSRCESLSCVSFKSAVWFLDVDDVQLINHGAKLPRRDSILR